MKFIFNIILLISKLPLKVLYFFSDVLFFLNFHIFGYRKAIVYNNIQNSFPEKSKKEILKIRKQFFENLSDYIVETIKSFTITSSELHVRVQHINQDVFHEANKEGKNIILLCGHVFNWEWITALTTIVPQKNSYPVYRKMQNSFWEEKLKKIRNSYGNTSIEANDVVRHIFKNKNDGNSIYMFVADQTPDPFHVDIGVPFLNQNTPAFIGYDKLATRIDLAFVYCDMKKVKRGYYQINYYRILPVDEKFEEFEVVKKFHIMLQKTIENDPANYLWSHRKWKYAHHIKRLISIN
jgi:KDO2-lipid IV(A) lauroyltransferase